MGKGRAVAIELDDVVRRELTALTRKHGAPQALAERGGQRTSATHRQRRNPHSV
jgi:hypothetical protein